MSTFKFVLIPTGKGALQELTRSTKGGLEKDELQIHAKKYLASSDDSEVHVQSMRNAMMDAGKDPLAAHPDMMSAVSNMGPSIEITCLYIARPANEYLSVTMYSDGNGEAKNRPVNLRATSIARACGHGHVTIHGDAFLARTFDNEEFPWKRRDFSMSETHLKAKWVLDAAAANTGKSLAGYSSSGQKQNLLKAQNPHSASATAAVPPTPPVAAPSKTQGPVTWTQTDDDIEVSVKLPAGVRGKDIAVTIKHISIKFGLKNGHSMSAEEGKGGSGALPTLLQRLQTGLRLYQKIEPDDSTWTLDDGHLLITLAKRESREWMALYE